MINAFVFGPLPSGEYAVADEHATFSVHKPARDVPEATAARWCAALRRETRVPVHTARWWEPGELKCVLSVPDDWALPVPANWSGPASHEIKRLSWVTPVLSTGATLSCGSDVESFVLHGIRERPL